MNRQLVSKTQKLNDSALLAPTDLFQRKGIDRTDYGASTVDTRSPSGQQRDNAGLPGVSSQFSYDFTKVPVRLNSRSLPIQAKLKIGQPNDKYEQEADRVAEQVMRMPEPRQSPSTTNSAPADNTNPHNGTIQRACASCSAEYKTPENENHPVQSANLCPKCRNQEPGLIQTKQITPLIQAKTTADATPEVTPAISSSIQSLQGGGRPLPKTERSFFEIRFGTDFSNVRVHNDTRAANVARSVNARAFTHGNNVVFGAGEYSPEAASGKRLLAHELTHVVQQSNGALTQIQRRTFGIGGACSFENCQTQLQNFFMIPEDGPPGFHPSGSGSSFRVDDVDGLWFKFHTPKEEWFKIPDIGIGWVTCAEDNEEAPSISSAILPFVTAAWSDDEIHTPNPY